MLQERHQYKNKLIGILPLIIEGHCQILVHDENKCTLSVGQRIRQRTPSGDLESFLGVC
jgi:hypothetical protein